MQGGPPLTIEMPLISSVPVKLPAPSQSEPAITVPGSVALPEPLAILPAASSPRAM